MQTNKCKKKLIITADDFGMSIGLNNAVLIGFKEGFLTNTCLCANGDAFDHAINEVLPQCPELGIGVHLNIIEGKTLRNKNLENSLLCKNDGTYKHSFHSLLFNSRNKTLLREIEDDFRGQIEKVLYYTEVDHLNSHVHTHAIPAIFEIVCKLAKEYNIPYVRTQYEKFYMIPSLSKHFNFWYPTNLIKVALLNFMTRCNKRTAEQYGIKINDYLIGVGYTGFMDSQTIEYGVKNLDSHCLAEILVHPYIPSGPDCLKGESRYVELKSILDHKLQEKIIKMGFGLTNFSNHLASQELIMT